MSQSAPRISIVIPVLNSVATMEKAILSVLNQNYSNTELIILDAGSKDGTVDVIKKYESHIAYWHSKPDGSAGLALNVGLTKATGELTGQLMADDWYEPDTFAKAAEAYVNHPGVEIISFAGRIVSQRANAKLSPRAASGAGSSDLLELQRYDTAEQLDINLYSMCHGIPALDARFITKKYLDKIGLLEPLDANGKHNYSIDRELLIRAAVLGCHNVFVPHLGHTYFAHEASATFGDNRGNQNKILQEHMDYVKSYFQKYPLTAEQRKTLRGWYADQSVRLFVWSLIAGNFGKAFKVSRDGLGWAGVSWLTALFSVPAGWAKKNLLGCGQKKCK